MRGNADHKGRRPGATRPGRTWQASGVTLVTLFTTTGTLVCCALPVTLVTLGLGTSVVALTGVFPFLIVLAQHKTWLFAFSGLLLGISGWLLFGPGRSCPTGEASARACATVQRWNTRIYWTSVAIWSTGFTAAYLLLPARIWLDR